MFIPRQTTGEHRRVQRQRNEQVSNNIRIFSISTILFGTSIMQYDVPESY